MRMLIVDTPTDMGKKVLQEWWYYKHKRHLLTI